MCLQVIRVGPNVTCAQALQCWGTRPRPPAHRNHSFIPITRRAIRRSGRGIVGPYRKFSQKGVMCMEGQEESCLETEETQEQRQRRLCNSHYSDVAELLRSCGINSFSFRQNGKCSLAILSADAERLGWKEDKKVLNILEAKDYATFRPLLVSKLQPKEAMPMGA